MAVIRKDTKGLYVKSSQHVLRPWNNTDFNEGDFVKVYYTPKTTLAHVTHQDRQETWKLDNV